MNAISHTEPFKLLIVDDEPDINELLSYNFRKRGFDVVTACNGKVAMETLNGFLPDVIILDIMMPVMNGVAFCRELKSIHRYKDIPVLFLSATSNDFLVDEALQAGGMMYLSKPIQIGMLIKVVTEMKKGQATPQ
jgi:two-component system, OmpR family, alkaline phosphatase synthesis response regulator PhoP